MVLGWILAAGGLIGFVFDWYRTFRRWRRWGPVFTFLGDVLFSFAALSILVVFLQRANFLAFRVYTFIGVLFGLLLYGKLFSRTVTASALKVYRALDWLLARVVQGLKYAFYLLAVLMRPFYTVLRWASLLFYRMGEALIWEQARVRRRQAGDWWNRHFPPRTNG